MRPTSWTTKVKLFAGVAAALLLAGAADAELLMKVPGIKGTSLIEGYDDGMWIPIFDLNTGVSRDLSLSGEKGGTADINIGVGELGTINISKRSDTSTSPLWQAAINGNSIGTVEIHQLAQLDFESPLVPIAKWKLDRTFVSSFNLSADGSFGSESLELYYNKIAFGIRDLFTDPGSKTSARFMGWDNVKNIAWTDHGLDFKEVQSLVGPQPAMACDPRERLCGADPLPGDANKDGSVTFVDFITLANNFGTPGSWADGDFSGDGVVDFGDFRQLAENFGESVSTIAAVPEPSSLFLMVVCGSLMFDVRRRRMRG